MMKEDNKNNQKSDNLIIEIAHIINRVYLQNLHHSTFLSILLIFQCSIQVSVFNRFLSSIHHQSYFRFFIDKVYQCLLLGANNKASNLLAINFVRFILTLLIGSNIIFILLFKKNHNTQTSSLKFFHNISRGAFSCLLLCSLPFGYFCSYNILNKPFSIMGIFDYINILLIILFIFCMQKFSIQIEYDSKRTILSTFSQNSAFIKVGQVVITYLFVRQVQNTNAYDMFLYLILFGLSFIKLRQMLTYRKYISSLYQQINQIATCIGFVNSFLIIIFTPFKIQLIDHNIGVIFIIVCFLFYYSFNVYIKFQRNQIFLNGQQAIKNQKMAILYVLQLIKIEQIDESKIDNKKSLIITLILQDHANHCRNLACLCQKGQKQQEKSNIIKQIILDSISKICNKFSSSFDLKLIQIGYKLLHTPKIINLSLQIQSLINIAKFKDLSFQSKFILYEFTYKIQKKCNQYKKMNKINCENIFLQESIKAQVSQLIIDLINATIQKYKLLSMDFYRINLIEDYSQKINIFIREIQVLWNKVGKINSFNFQIYQIFIFYYKNIVTSRIEAKHMAEEINSKLQKISLLKNICKESANKYIYSKKTCIIESHIEESFGIVTNITNNCNEILGIAKQHLINKGINQSMCDYFAKGHQQAMSNWLQNCVISSSSQEMIEFGFVDLRYFCFQGYLFMKVLSNGQRLLFYSMIIRQNEYDYFLLNSNLQIEGIGKRFLKQQILNMGQIKHNIRQYSDFSNGNVKLGKKVKSKIIFQKQLSTVKAYQTNKQISARSFQKNILKYQCSVTIGRYGIGKRQYYLIKLESITKWLSAQSCKQIKMVGQIKPTGSNIKRSLQNYDNDFLIQDDYQSLDSFNPARYTRINKMSIQNSSLSDDSGQIYSYNNFIYNVKKYLIHPQIIPSTFYKKNTFFIILISICLIVQVFSLRTVFVVGFKSFNDVMFGDGAVSDNNQILQMMYNNVLMSRTYCSDESTTERCKYLINSTIFVTNILYDLYVSDLQVYLVNKTSLTKLKFYQSYDVPVIFTIGNTSESISTLQFMEYYYYAVYQHNTLISQGKRLSKQANDVMSILLDNWEQMKFINHNAILLYLSAGQTELTILNGYLLMLVGGVFAFLILLGIRLNRYYDYLHQKKIGILQIYQEINSQLGKDMGMHYQTLKQLIVTNQYPILVVPRIQDEEHTYRKKQIKYVRNKCYLVQIISVLIILMLFGGLQFLQISLILPPCRNMVTVINNLMDSQNYLLQSYFELKTYYLQFNFSKSVDQISQQITVQLNSPQPSFTTMSKQSINLFNGDPTFANNFNHLLVFDACNLTAYLFQSWQVDYCYDNLDPLLTLGVMNSMTYFYRNSFEALNQLKRRQLQNINKTQYFKQQVYRDIDDSLFYMFRLYQATQARMYQGLNYIVNSSLFILDFLNSLSTAILVMIIIWWAYNFKHQREQMSNLYGIVLQFPEIIMKKTVISIIKDQLQIKV